MSQHPADFLQAETDRDVAFAAECDEIARSAETLEIRVRALTPTLHTLSRFDPMPEINANLMLAVRALEDAQLRLRLAIKRAQGQ